MNADRVRNVVGQPDQFEHGAAEDAALVSGAGLGASAVHPLGGEAGHDAERSSHKLGAEGVKDHDIFKVSDKLEAEKSAEGTKKAETAEGSVVDHFEREASEGAASVPGAGVHPLGGGVGHDAERSHQLGIENGFKASEKNTAEGAKEVETTDGSVIGKFEREGAASVPGAGLGASGAHSLGGGAGQDAERSDEIGAEGVKIHQDHDGSEKVEGEKDNTAEGAKEETAADALGSGVLEHGVGGPTGSISKADHAKLSDKTADKEDEYRNKDSENQREDGDDADREQDGGCARAAARWAIGGLVGLGAALVAYAAVRARYQPFNGGAGLQRDSLIVDDATTAVIPHDRPYCLFDGSNVPMDSASLHFQDLESRTAESRSEIGSGEHQDDKWTWVFNDTPAVADNEITPESQESPSSTQVYGDYEMGWEKFIPRGGTATAVASTPGLFDGSNGPLESVSLPFQKLESSNSESSEIGFGEPEDKWAWVLKDKIAETEITLESQDTPSHTEVYGEIEITPESQDTPSHTEVYGDYEMGWKKSIPRGGTATAVASTQAVEDLSYGRITIVTLVIPMLMYI